MTRVIRSRLPLIARITLFIGMCSSVCTAQTVTTFDVLIATGNLTIVGTTTVQGNALSVGGSTLAVIGGNVGIGTGTPTAQLHLVGPVVYISTAQFRWIASRAALRAGEVIGSNWDLPNVGINSIGLGFNPLNIQPFGTISGGYSNTMNYGNGNSSVIGGGDANGIYGFNSDASVGTVSGGQSNSITNYSAGTIGGGAGNDVFSAGGTIAGGGYNSVGVDGLSNSYATVGGGAYNKAYAYASVIAGGGAVGPAQTNGGNIIHQDAIGATILGGANNYATKSYSAIGGGAFNTAGGAYATVVGGYKNSSSGDYSFAAGSAAVSSARGSFVWADSQNQQLISNTTDEFKIRAGGGFVLLGSPTLATIIVSSGSLLISTSATAANAVPNLFISSTTGNVGIGTNLPGTTFDVQGAAQFGPGTSKSTFTAAPGGSTYALQLSSGITISGGGPINLTTGGFIRFPDGTTSATASSGAGAVSSSTYVRLCGGDQTPTGGQNTQGTAATITSSTASMSFAAGSWAEVSITLFHYADGTQYNVDLYVDNARPSWVGSNGLMTCQGSASSIIGSCTGVFPIPVTTGAHVFYLKIWRGGNPVALQMSNPCSYYTVKEMPAIN